MASAAPPIRSHIALAYPAALLGIATFSLMDALMKGLTIELGAANAMIWRSWIGLLIIAPIYFATRVNWPTRQAMKLHLLRGSIGGVMAFTFFWGIARVPLAEGIAISFFAPLGAIWLSAIFLHEKIRPSAIFASVLSLTGVALIAIVRATGDYNAETLLGLGAIVLSAIFYAGNITLMRAQAQSASPSEIAFFQHLIVSTMLLAIAPFYLALPDGNQLWRMSGASALTVFSLFILAWAYARGQTQKLVSTEYTAFLWASLFGWWWFAEDVTISTVAGCALIVAGCLIAARQDGREARNGA